MYNPSSFLYLLKHTLVTFMFVPCIWNNKCLLYTNICTNN